MLMRFVSSQAMIAHGRMSDTSVEQAVPALVASEEA